MTTKQSVELFLRVIKERHGSLISESTALLRELARNDNDSKKIAAEKTLQVASDLQAILSQRDVPSWLHEIISFLKNFLFHGWDASEFLAHFVSVKPQINNHQWAFDETENSAFDFDTIFEHFKKESRLPELFDQIIRILEDIQNSGEVDSMAMIRSLAKVIATIKRCKDGSYFSLNSAWEFLLSFLKNYMWEELSKLPVLGTAMEALQKTIEEANEEMFKVHRLVQEELERTVTAEVKALTNKSSFQFVSYNKDGYLLPGADVRRLPDATA